MTLRRLGQAAFGTILLCSLLFGSSVHALVPHEHGETHEHSGESIVWQSLHSSLRHEDKKAIPLFDALTVVGVAFIIVFAQSVHERILRTDAMTNALRRGILPHRKFG